MTETKTLEIDLVRAVRPLALTVWITATAAIAGLHERDDKIAELEKRVSYLEKSTPVPTTPTTSELESALVDSVEVGTDYQNAEIQPIWEAVRAAIDGLKSRDAELARHNAHALAQFDRVASRDRTIEQLQARVLELETAFAKLLVPVGDVCRRLGGIYDAESRDGRTIHALQDAYEIAPHDIRARAVYEASRVYESDEQAKVVVSISIAEEPER